MSATGERRDSGTTLIEVLVAFSILALVSALVFPSGERVLARLALRQNQAVLAAALEEARADAVAGARPTAFAVSSDGRSFGWSGRAARAMAGAVLARSDRKAIVFFPDGTSTGGRLALRAERTVLGLSVDPATGAVRTIG